jgi:hypothetical protein
VNSVSVYNDSDYGAIHHGDSAADGTFSSDRYRFNVTVLRAQVLYEGATGVNDAPTSERLLEVLITGFQLESSSEACNGPECARLSSTNVTLSQVWISEHYRNDETLSIFPVLFFGSLDSIGTKAVTITDRSDVTIVASYKVPRKRHSGSFDEASVTVSLRPVVVVFRPEMLRWSQDFRSLDLSGNSESSCRMTADIRLETLNLIAYPTDAAAQSCDVDTKAVIDACKVVRAADDESYTQAQWFHRRHRLLYFCQETYATMSRRSVQTEDALHSIECPTGIMLRVDLSDIRFHLSPERTQKEDARILSAEDLEASQPLVCMASIHAYLRVEHCEKSESSSDPMRSHARVFELGFMKVESSNDRAISLRKFPDYVFSENPSIPADHSIPQVLRTRTTRNNRSAINASGINSSEVSDSLAGGRARLTHPMLHGGDVLVLDSHRILFGMFCLTGMFTKLIFRTQRSITLNYHC